MTNRWLYTFMFINTVFLLVTDRHHPGTITDIAAAVMLVSLTGAVLSRSYDDE